MIEVVTTHLAQLVGMVAAINPAIARVPIVHLVGISIGVVLRWWLLLFLAPTALDGLSAQILVVSGDDGTTGGFLRSELDERIAFLLEHTDVNDLTEFLEGLAEGLFRRRCGSQAPAVDGAVRW